MEGHTANGSSVEKASIENEVNKNEKNARDPTYFHYYSLLMHQQNMLQDSVRTSTYQKAILQNPQLYNGKTVMDVGAGSGILSFFAVQAGAKVIAVEASNMALKLQKIVDASNPLLENPKNPWMHGKIQVICKKIEEVNLPANCVDTIISEPIGVLLVHERMIESFLYARDHFLKPGGTMVPSQGSIFLAPFTDSALWMETRMKTRFWEANNFYGVDISTLKQDAFDEQFLMPVVGYFDPQSLMASPTRGGYLIDFQTIKMEELKEFSIPITWIAEYTGIIHGIATWFDLFFNSKDGVNVFMSTSPRDERTHWQQVRLLLSEPIAVNAGQVISGELHFKVNEMRSYDLVGNLTLYSGQPPNLTPVLNKTFTWYLHEQTYNYSYMGPTGQDIKPEQLGLYEISN